MPVCSHQTGAEVSRQQRGSALGKPSGPLVGALEIPILSFSLFCLLLFRATSEAYGGSQARGQIRAAAAGLHQSHSNMGSKPHL